MKPFHKHYIPEIMEADLLPAEPGIRAQAIEINGKLVDDFVIERGPNSLHILNAPSPAATASLPIGAEIVKQLENYNQ